MPDPTVTVQVSRTTKLHFSWTAEQIEAMLLAEAKRYVEERYTAQDRITYDMRFGAMYEGGIDARCTVDIHHAEP